MLGFLFHVSYTPAVMRAILETLAWEEQPRTRKQAFIFHIIISRYVYLSIYDYVIR